MQLKAKSVLFVGKKNDLHSERALEFIRRNFKDVCAEMGKQGDSLPEDICWWRGDYIVSYLARWVLPENLLKRAEVAAINFHPAPPEYPGTGCINFAIYEGAKLYGVTCHHMIENVDSGSVICVKKFPIYNTDSIETLLERTYDYQLSMFYDVMNQIIESDTLPVSKESWTRKPLTRKQLDDLATISPNMSEEEITKRIRATTFGPWKPIVKIKDFTFELQD